MPLKLYPRNLADRVVFVYGMISLLWLLVTNPLLNYFIHDPQLLIQAAALRGAVLAILASVLLHRLIRRSERQTYYTLCLLQAIVNGTTDAVFVKDLEGHCVLANNTTAELMGQTVGSIIGKNNYDLIPLEYAAKVEEVDRQILAQRQVLTVKEVLQFHGQMRTYSSTKYPWYDTAGRVRGLIGISRDITTQIQLEQERLQLLRELQQQNQALLALNAVTENAISTLELNVLLQTLLTRLVHVIPSQAGTIFLQVDQGLEVGAVVGAALVSETAGRAIAFKLAQALTLAPQPLHIENIECDSRFQQVNCDRCVTRSVMGVPLKRHDRLIGILLVEWDTPQPYDEQRVRLLEITAERCAMAFLNAQLFEQTKQLQERLQLQIDCMPIGLVINDHNGYFIEWNPAAEHIFGYTRAEVIHQQTCDLITPPSLAGHINSIHQQALITGESNTSINTNITKDGRILLCEWHNTPLRDNHGVLMGVLSMVQDVTERKQSEERLQESEARFRSLIDSLPFRCWACDGDGTYTYQNAPDRQQWGNIVGRNIEEVITSTEEIPEYWRTHYRCARESTVCAEAEYTVRDELRHALSIVAPIREGDRFYGVVGVNIDITERKRAEAQLRQYAFYDILTGLPQRTLLLERLADLMQACTMGDRRKFALLHLDLVRFKTIKYSLGHHLAEALLVAMAERLQALMPPHAMLTRTGGADEFSILLYYLNDFNEAIHFAEFVLEQLAAPFLLREHELFVNASIGIVFSSVCEDKTIIGVNEFFQAADTAMHQSRQAGVGKYAVFDPSTQVQAVQRLQLDSELRRALDHEELLLHYQPIINLKTRELTGFEALVRWQSSHRGMVSPAEFIPLAEETGLIIPLGAWILRRACEQLQQWNEQFPDKPPLTLNVNLSTVQLLQPDLLNQIDRILCDTQAPAHQLKLEITETSIVQNAQQVTPILQALKDRQILLSIDDFGTGYSSLTYLHTFPLDTLKVDRAFVSGIGKKTKSSEITRTIILLAHTLNLDVVAEGIETTSQMEQLQALHCDRGQGFLFSLPLTPDEANQLLSRDRWIL